MIALLTQTLQPNQSPDYSHAQQITGAAVVVGLIVITVIGAIIWGRRRH